METSERVGLYGSGDHTPSMRMSRSEKAEPITGGLKDSSEVEWRVKWTKPNGRRKKALIATVAIAFAAVAVFVVAQALTPAASLHAFMSIPPPPNNAVGFTIDGSGAPIPSVQFVLTDKTTGINSGTLTSDPTTGVYIYDLNALSGIVDTAISAGDIINITATTATLIGWNETPFALTGIWGFMWFNVTLNHTIVIPEFGLLLPVAGMIGLVAAVSVVSRRKLK